MFNTRSMACHWHTHLPDQAVDISLIQTRLQYAVYVNKVPEGATVCRIACRDPDHLNWLASPLLSTRITPDQEDSRLNPYRDKTWCANLKYSYECSMICTRTFYIQKTTLDLVMSNQRFLKIVCFRFPTNVPLKIEYIRF